MNDRYGTYHTVVGHRIYTIVFFGMSVSYSKTAAHVPTFNLFRIPLRRRRPHEPSSRPPFRPSPGAVEAGGHVDRRIKRKIPPRVEKGVTKRGE